MGCICCEAARQFGKPWLRDEAIPLQTRYRVALAPSPRKFNDGKRPARHVLPAATLPGRSSTHVLSCPPNS